MSVQVNTSQIFVEPKIRDEDLKASLREEGVQIGYPFCQVALQSERHLMRIQDIFEYYGWTMEIYHGAYHVTQNVEDIEV